MKEFRVILIFLLGISLSGCSVSAYMSTFNFDFHISEKVFSPYSCNDMIIFAHDFTASPADASAELIGLDYYSHTIPNYAFRNIIENVSLKFHAAVESKGC
jgi:hypothetical protein